MLVLFLFIVAVLLYSAGCACRAAPVTADAKPIVVVQVVNVNAAK